MASDVKLAHLPDDPVGALTGASFDFKAAHKQIQVRPEEHGLLLFAHHSVLYHYRVCHFGGRFSAYWWQRFSAFVLRQIQSLLGGSPHRAWLYVDDLLAQLHRPAARDQLLLLVIHFQAILAPMSWWGLHLLVRLGFRFRGRHHRPDFGQAPKAQEPTPGTPPGEEDPQTAATTMPWPSGLGD